MSQPTTGKNAPGQGSTTGPQAPAAASSNNPSATYKTSARDCAVLARGFAGPIVAAGKLMGVDNKIAARIIAWKGQDSEPWLGFQLDFPLGECQVGNEKSGFGVRHRYNSSLYRVLPYHMHTITVKFPRGNFQCFVEDADETLQVRFPNAKGSSKGLALVSIHLSDTDVTVAGFGQPFSNAGDAEAEGWINENKSIVDGLTLLDTLRQRDFYFVVSQNSKRPAEDFLKDYHKSRLPPPFSYPYGNEHDWNVARFKKLLRENKSPRPFLPAYSFDDDNALVTVLTQSIVQDVMWLDDEAQEIRQTKFPVYFINSESVSLAEAKRFHVVMRLSKDFLKRHDAAWRRLTKTQPFELHLFDEAGDEEPAARWNCVIQDHPESVEALKAHPVDGTSELMLYVRRAPSDKGKHGLEFPVKTFGDRLAANSALEKSAERKVTAACLFSPNAAPTNAASFQASTEEELRDRMELHRALMRGAGFYDWMNKRSGSDVDIIVNPDAIEVDDSDSSATLRPLPVYNFLDIGDEAYVDAIMREALPDDRSRFRQYLSKRPLGLSLITAGPGFGKTTCGAAIALAMQAKLGHILCSGPTNVSVDNFANRLDRISTSIVEHYNAGKAEDDPSRAQIRVVVRAYKPADETATLLRLLEHPHEGDDAAPGDRVFRAETKWKLHLSVTFWMMVLLRHPGVRQLRPDDGKALHDLRADWDSRADLERLRAVASGGISWQEYQDSGGVVSKNKITALANQVLDAADLLCTTPAMTVNYTAYAEWKKVRARGIAIDEAGAMDRADLACVWGNTLLPALLLGDCRQLGPVVATGNEVDSLENRYHRLVDDAKISALGWLEAVGMPTYRLHVQLRMSEGLHDHIAEEVYPDVPMRYSESCRIDQPRFQVGRDLESYIQETYPDVTAPPVGKLLPVFIHCEGSRVFVDPITRSKRSPQQVKIALDFLVGFVKAKQVDPSRIVVIAPYSANIETIRRMRRRSEYAALAGIPPASTVDSFQGQEGDICVVIMGTAHPKPGPGFTSEENRLNVMLSRQKCGLVVVGDINVAGVLDGKGKGKGHWKWKGAKAPEDRFLVEGVSGEISWVKATRLRNMYKRLFNSGRFIRIPVAETKAGPSTPAS